MIAGGCAYFGGIVAQSLGAQCSLLTAVGEDFLLDHVFSYFDQTHLIQKGKTTVFTNYYPPNQPRYQRVDASASMISIQDVPTSWLTPKDLLFVAPVLGEINPKESKIAGIK